MGIFVNPRVDKDPFLRKAQTTVFVDKSLMINVVIREMEEGRRLHCVTRPRRFGKTLAASMIAAFFGKQDTKADFDRLKISKTSKYAQYINRYNVVYVTMDATAESYGEFISRFEDRLRRDILRQWPDLDCGSTTTLDECLEMAYLHSGEEFVFVIDEWDKPFSAWWATDREKQSYLEYLRFLFKDRRYVALCYLTGILPIGKNSPGSALNNFLEDTFLTPSRFAEFFGFTHEEVQGLYNRAQQRGQSPDFSLDDLEYWYDGYQLAKGRKLYNPRSIDLAFNAGQVGFYWNDSGSQNEVRRFAQLHIEGTKSLISRLADGEKISIRLEEPAVVSWDYSTVEGILAMMVVSGLLTYDGQHLWIPNNEVKTQFLIDLHNDTENFPQISRRVHLTHSLIQAIRQQDEVTVAQLIQEAHERFGVNVRYNNELELFHVLMQALSGITDSTIVEREAPAGVGVADIVVLSGDVETGDNFIIELKVDAPPEAAIEQIKSRRYIERIERNPHRQGRVFAVGISYMKTDPSKTHACRIEQLR